jgi:hypothetical protein
MHHIERPVASMRAAAFIVVLAFLLPSRAFAAGCNDPTRQAVTHIALPGSPFTPIPSENGCWIFVALPNTTRPMQGGIAVLKRFGGEITLTRVVPVQGAPTGMVLSHDGSLLIAASSSRVAFLDVTSSTHRGGPSGRTQCLASFRQADSRVRSA